ncbi:hypothetical protein IV487_03180 [Enterococcus saccharolyticus]|nr:MULTISPECIES: hypothetical protein [Enterococcus]MCD5001470.1 hypothetical protein [Enterococcus saccharolyticus]
MYVGEAQLVEAIHQTSKMSYDLEIGELMTDSFVKRETMYKALSKR